MIKKFIILHLLIFPLPLSAQQKPHKRSKKEDKKVNYAFLPIIMYNRSFGGQFGIMANAYFNVNKKDTISPASNIAFIGNIYIPTKRFLRVCSAGLTGSIRYMTCRLRIAGIFIGNGAWSHLPALLSQQTIFRAITTVASFLPQERGYDLRLSRQGE